MSNSTKRFFERQGLPDMLLQIVSKQTPGQLLLSSQTNQAIIYFGVGRILAAICEPFKGVPAIRAVLQWQSGQSEFVPEMVLLSNLPHDIWVRTPLAEVLRDQSDIEPSVSREVIQPPLQVVQDERISAAFINELEKILKHLVGPFGGVLLEDAAENIGVDIDALTKANLPAWLSELKKLVPTERRQVFEARLSELLKTIE